MFSKLSFWLMTTWISGDGNSSSNISRMSAAWSAKFAWAPGRLLTQFISRARPVVVRVPYRAKPGTEESCGDNTSFTPCIAPGPSRCIADYIARVMGTRHLQGLTLRRSHTAHGSRVWLAGGGAGALLDRPARLPLLVPAGEAPANVEQRGREALELRLV